MAHAPLLRTNTAPIIPKSADGVARLRNTMSLASATRASQLSGTTAYNSSLESLGSGSTIVAMNNSQVMATTNIINQKADASRSLYQICVSLKQRLAQVPGFEGYFMQLEEMAMDPNAGGPVESLWNLLRTGRPLVAIFNALQTGQPIEIEGAPDSVKTSKIAILKFMSECIQQLKLPESQRFIINDLLGDDTTGFVKVTGVINYILDLAEQKGLLNQVQPYPEDEAIQPGSKMSYRDFIVKELVDTERKYVQDLENLYDLKKALEQRSSVPGDTLHQIFLNINNILDFQRRFLIRVETTYSQPESKREWGAQFVANEESFKDIYQPFIANQRKAAQVAGQVFDKIKAIEHPVACDFNTLDGFLLKPMQRLVKYPLLLKDLMKKSEDEGIKLDLASGIAAAESVLFKANEAVNRDLLDEALDDLISRVDDWKNHRVEQFGKLLLHGVYTVVTGKSDQAKDYEIYLFECILLCCKEITPNRSKDKKDKTKSTGPKIRNRSAKLQLKGRIFMTNVTDVVAISKTGSYTVQIWWKGDPGVENFMIKFQNEEMMKKWAAGLDQQRKENSPQTQQSPDAAAPTFTWMATQGTGLENPYAQQEEDDDSDSYGSTPTPSQYGPPQGSVALPGTLQRNASSTSLRNRSDTGQSMTRAPPPPRFPLPQPPAPLSLQTQNGTQPYPSPGPRGGDSYFSPVAESPASSRASTTSGMFPSSAGYQFPVGMVAPQGWVPGEENRYTAPAMPRAPSRDGPSPALNGRNPRGPSMPVLPRDANQMQQQRSRSYSTPDINGQQPNGRRSNGQSVPAVPGIPPHLTHERHDSNIPRSNSGSPANDLPIRTNTQSPGAQRAREQRQYGGTMAQFPTQPIYNRQGTPASANGLPYPGPPPAGLAPLAPADPARAGSPPLAAAQNPLASPTPDVPLPTSLKVKVNYNGNYITLVVNYTITYQTLIDRIDNKLSRFTSSSIGRGNLKLRYRDEDGDFVTIESDDDIQIAISEWREGARNQYTMPGSLSEIELFCVGDTN